ncbi:MAG: hypothetical protein KAS07_02495 [Candidatus Pacebacteria bacterium]|nr:hypothetical protein [Candidatus Paceibacterota bacterium]
MTKFDTPKKVLDEFHSFIGSGLSMDYHMNGMPEKILVEELAQRDIRHGQEPDRDIYQKYIKALVLQKKLLRTSDERIFTYSEMQRKILEEKGLIPKEERKTNWWALSLMVLFLFLVLYISRNF